jgi:hypothetical protein
MTIQISELEIGSALESEYKSEFRILTIENSSICLLVGDHAHTCACSAMRIRRCHSSPIPAAYRVHDFLAVIIVIVVGRIKRS